mgnify:CR=1 FL=1
MICKFKSFAFIFLEGVGKTDMEHIILHTIEDSIKLYPFLLLAYLFMGFLESATGKKAEKLISDAGRFGPLVGGICGAFPQCGFSAVSSNFYAGGVIGLGSLIAVFMSTSDEMLPVFIAENASAKTIIGIIAAKVVMGSITGFLVMILFRRFAGEKKEIYAVYSKEHSHSCCEHGVVKGAFVHSAKTFALIFIVTLIINTVIHTMGQEMLSRVFADIPVLGELIAAAVGLIPNCAASVVISQLYLDGLIGSGAMMSGLLSSAGVGLIVLFEENKNVKENLFIVGLLYASSVLWGVLIEGLGIVF